MNKEIKDKLNEGQVINAPGVLEHLEALGYDIDGDARMQKTKALFICEDYVDALKAAINYKDANYLLPKDILDIPIPEPVVTEWDYQVGDVVELGEDRGHLKEGRRFIIGRVDKKDPYQPIGVIDPIIGDDSFLRWPPFGTFRLVQKAERKVTVEMTKETYESLKDALKNAKVIND